MKKINKWFLMIVVLLGILAFAGCSKGTAALEPIIIGEYIGTVMDDGYNIQHNDDIRVYKDTKNNKLVYVFRNSVFVIAP